MSTEMEEHVDLLERDHSLSVVLPEGLKKNITVHGSKPVMDVLVMLCASYRLNLPDYTVEFLSPNKNNISFKPNSPIGSLEAEQIVMKLKGAEEKPKKPYVPEATVRLLVNYNTSYKTVLRVNPRLPLQLLLPAVCDKCEFNLETTVLLRDSQSKEPLDLTKSLNDYELREVFAEDTAAKDSTEYQSRTAETAVTPTEVICPPSLQDLPRREKKQKTRCFFSFLRRSRKHESHGPASAPGSPVLRKRVGAGVNQPKVSSTNPPPAELPKKRRAPLPPLGVSLSVPNSLSSCQVNGAQRSATLRSTKRRAPPPPPCANTTEEQRADTEVGVESLNTLELKETDESSNPSQPRPPSSSRPSLTHVHQVADSFMQFRGKDLSDARTALARVLTSSMSKGALVTRLRNSAAFTNFTNVSSCVSLTTPCPGEGHACTEHESDLPTEGEWEDPVQRKGLTTFKVVPPNKTPPCDSEPTLVRPGSDLGQTEPSPAPEASPKAENYETETEGSQCSPGGSENRTRSLSPELSASLLPRCDVDHQNSSNTAEEQEEERKEEQEEEQEAQHNQEQEAQHNQEQEEERKEEQEAQHNQEQEAQHNQEQEEERKEEQEAQHNQEQEVEQEAQHNQEQEVEQEAQHNQEQEVERKEEQEEEHNQEQEVQHNQEQEVEQEAQHNQEQEVEQEEQHNQEQEVEQEEQHDQKQEEEDEDEAKARSEMIPDCSDEETTNLDDPRGFVQSPGADLELCASCTDEKKPEEEDVSFPPPPPPVFFNEEPEREPSIKSPPSASPPAGSASNGYGDAFRETCGNDPTSALSEPARSGTNPGPSRFAQAVATAVRRSRLQSSSKASEPQASSGPPSRLPSPPRSTFQHGA